MATVPAQEVADRMAIQQVVSDHSRALDRVDEALLGACYWPDAEVNYAFFEGTAAEFIPIVLAMLKERFALTRHTLSNHRAWREGELYYSETQVTARHLSTCRQEDVTQYARYLDTFERRGDEWRLKHRLVATDWVQRLKIDNIEDEPGIAEMTKVRSQHDETDPSYSLPPLKS